MADSANSDAALAYGVGGFPSFVIVGADGTVEVRSSGEPPVADLDALVKAGGLQLALPSLAASPLCRA